ncbi:hypothetical protein H0H81_000910 [Sphagnurus paluster]|uniref:Uncharacterized protein n=1 Tax=Sphagnurus paluster TaxID=117069 RepID=A0A9P7K6U5_9AGAR|nr:hypothetical protein H0H81_000910 [Sphagnurus paluster]
MARLQAGGTDTTSDGLGANATAPTRKPSGISFIPPTSAAAAAATTSPPPRKRHRNNKTPVVPTRLPMSTPLDNSQRFIMGEIPATQYLPTEAARGSKNTSFGLLISTSSSSESAAQDPMQISRLRHKNYLKNLKFKKKRQISPQFSSSSSTYPKSTSPERLADTLNLSMTNNYRMLDEADTTDPTAHVEAESSAPLLSETAPLPVSDQFLEDMRMLRETVSQLVDQLTTLRQNQNTPQIHQANIPQLPITPFISSSTVVDILMKLMTHIMVCAPLLPSFE